jgi:hypothetical protein
MLNLNKVVDVLTGKQDEGKKKIKGTVVLMKKNVLDFNDFSASVLDRVDEFLGKRVSLQLISSANGNPGLFLLHPNWFLLLQVLKVINYKGQPCLL